MSELLKLTIAKLHQEIWNNDALLFRVVLALFSFIVASYILTIVPPISDEAKQKLHILIILLATSSAWLIARQELMIHSAGAYLIKIERQQVDEDVSEGWEIFKANLTFRNNFLWLFDALASIVILYIVSQSFIALKSTHPIFLIIFGFLFIAGIIMIWIANNYAGR